MSPSVYKKLSAMTADELASVAKKLGVTVDEVRGWLKDRKVPKKHARDLTIAAGLNPVSSEKLAEMLKQYESPRNHQTTTEIGPDFP